MMQIQYITGDATNPVGEENKIIVHVCNDIGGWGKGFVMAISAKWKKPEMEYRNWHNTQLNFSLGQVQFILVEENIWVANIIGQKGIKADKEGQPPIRYEAIKNGLSTVATFAIQNNASVHMPRIGCGLAGGKWEKMEPIINETLIKKDVAVTVYDFQ